MLGSPCGVEAGRPQGIALPSPGRFRNLEPMNEAASKLTPRSIYYIANELCERYQRQIDTLQQGTLAGLPRAEIKQYEARKRRIADLQAELKASGPPPS
jgi:hypothetical protein